MRASGPRSQGSFHASVQPGLHSLESKRIIERDVGVDDRARLRLAVHRRLNRQTASGVEAHVEQTFV